MEEPALDLIENFLGSSLVFASAVRRVIEQGALRDAVGEDLTESQLKLLKLLSLSDTHSLNEVAAFLGISNAAASKAVDKLVNRMLLRRTEGEADRRSIHLSLTEPARQLLAAYDSALRRRLREILGGFSEDELIGATEILNRFTGRIVGNSSQSPEICLQCGMYFPARCVVREQLGRTCDYLSRRAGKQMAEAEAGATRA